MNQEETHLSDIYKVILVGDTSTGKTNIIFSFTKQKIPNNIMPTVALEYTSKIVELQDRRFVRTQIWDTAGQEQYRALTMKHYQKALGAFIVFDVTNRNSFLHVNQWLSAVIDKADTNVQIGLLGHKVDNLRREVSREQAEALAQKSNIFYAQTTVKDPNTIKSVFNKLLTNMANIKFSEVRGIKLNEKQIRKHSQQNNCC